MFFSITKSSQASTIGFFEQWVSNLGTCQIISFEAEVVKIKIQLKVGFG